MEIWLYWQDKDQDYIFSVFLTKQDDFCSIFISIISLLMFYLLILNVSSVQKFWCYYNKFSPLYIKSLLQYAKNNFSVESG